MLNQFWLLFNPPFLPFKNQGDLMFGSRCRRRACEEWKWTNAPPRNESWKRPLEAWSRSWRRWPRASKIGTWNVYYHDMGNWWPLGRASTIMVYLFFLTVDSWYSCLLIIFCGTMIQEIDDRPVQLESPECFGSHGGGAQLAIWGTAWWRRKLFHSLTRGSSYQGYQQCCKFCWFWASMAGEGTNVEIA